MLHPVSSNDNILHNHSALSKPRNGPGHNTILKYRPYMDFTSSGMDILWDVHVCVRSSATGVTITLVKIQNWSTTQRNYFGLYLNSCVLHPNLTPDYH